MVKQAVLIKSNLVEQSIIRMPKVINTLKKAGYDISVVSWDRDSKCEQKRKHGEYEETSLKLNAPWGINCLPFLPIWWCYVLFQLLVKKWDIAHAINFDTLIPTVIAGQLKRKPVVYEIVDVYADVILLPAIIRYIGLAIDKFLMRFVSAVMLIDDAQIMEFGGIPNSNVITVYDTPPDDFVDVDLDTQKNDVFTLFYAGYFCKARRMNIDEIFTAVRDIDDVQIVVAGYGDQVGEIELWSKKVPEKIKFLGFITHEDVHRWSNKADLLVVARTPATLNNVYNCGSTFLRAMMYGKPFLANKGTATADKVSQYRCGLNVDAYSVNEIKGAIVELRDAPNLCMNFGVNAKTAYELNFRWEIMEKRLLAVYKELLVCS